MNNLALTCQALGRYEDAKPLFKRVLEIEEKFHSPQYPEHPEISASFYNLAKLHEDQEKHSEAKSLYKRVLEMQEKAYDPKHPKVANALADMARLDKRIVKEKGTRDTTTR